jgi:hypothetical protein
MTWAYFTVKELGGRTRTLLTTVLNGVAACRWIALTRRNGYCGVREYPLMRLRHGEFVTNL